MPRQMRRKDRALSETEARAILAAAEYGVLSTVNPEGAPYAVPLSFILDGDLIYFHCAPEGEKLDNIATRPAVCFTVAGNTAPIACAGNFGTLYESVLACGEAALVENADEKRDALFRLTAKYFPDHLDSIPAYLEKNFKHTSVYKIRITRLSGKARRK